MPREPERVIVNAGERTIQGLGKEKTDESDD